MNKICAVALTWMVSGNIAVADSLPSFPKRTTYGEARTALLALGWAPSKLSGSERYCDHRPSMCVHPEVVACAATGRGDCETIWKKGSKLIEIGTIGDAPEMVATVKCRANCR